MKKGFETSEFWIALSGVGTILWTFVQQNCILDPLRIYGLCIALLGIVGGYIGSRTYLKAKAIQSAVPVKITPETDPKSVFETTDIPQVPKPGPVEEPPV